MAWYQQFQSFLLIQSLVHRFSTISYIFTPIDMILIFIFHIQFFSSLSKFRCLYKFSISFIFTLWTKFCLSYFQLSNLLFFFQVSLYVTKYLEIGILFNNLFVADNFGLHGQGRLDISTYMTATHFCREVDANHFSKSQLNTPHTFLAQYLWRLKFSLQPCRNYPEFHNI